MEALQLYRRILATRHGTWTEARAAFNFASRSREVGDPKMHEDGQQALFDLAKSDHPSPFAWQAKVVLAYTLMRDDRFHEADRILASMPADATDRYVTRARYIREQIRDSESNLWQYLGRDMPRELVEELEPLT